MTFFKPIIIAVAVLAMTLSAGAADKKITKKEIRDIVEDFEATQHSLKRSSLMVDRVKVKKIEDLNVLVTITYYEQDNPRSGSSGTYTPSDTKGYIQLTPEGKIKYDPIYRRHPMEIAQSRINSLIFLFNKSAELADESRPDRAKLEENQKSWGLTIDTLSKMEIPLAGLDTTTPVVEQKESLEIIIEWFCANAETWDRGEPLTPLPEQQSKELVKSLKKAERTFL